MARGSRKRVAARQNVKGRDWTPGLRSSLGSRVTVVDALLEPRSYLTLDPANPAAAEVAEPYPLGELAGVFEALYVLVRVEDELLQLLLRQ